MRTEPVVVNELRVDVISESAWERLPRFHQCSGCCGFGDDTEPWRWIEMSELKTVLEGSQPGKYVVKGI